MTFRLADSLPAEALARLIAERDSIVQRAAANSRPLSDMELARLNRLHSDRIDRFLDSGAGDCFLARVPIASMVQRALLHFDGQRYELLAWCIMPNHVHTVFTPRSGFGLSGILHSWKSFTANQANSLLGRKGLFWQHESFDHLIRDEDDLRHAITYVLANPVAAGLTDWPWVGCKEARRRDPRDSLA